MAAKYEYKVVKQPKDVISERTMTKWLNRMGKDGWQLITFDFQSAYFKKEIQ